MPLVDRHCRAAAGALLALVLGAAPGASFAQSAMGVEAGRRAVELQRRSVEVERLRAEQRRGAARSMAHARMPDTMYASTPDPAPPPHPVPIEVKRPGAPERSAADGPARPPVESPGHRIPLFVSASDASGAEGYVRIVNRSDASGEVRIEGYDDAGVRHGPVTLPLGAGEAVHLGATDLERGNGALGLSGSLGAGEGDWRLEMSSALDLEVLGYVRSADGFLSAMHDVVPRGEGGHRVVWFNPGEQHRAGEPASHRQSWGAGGRGAHRGHRRCGGGVGGGGVGVGAGARVRARSAPPRSNRAQARGSPGRWARARGGGAWW